MQQRNRLSSISLIKKPVFTKKAMRLLDFNQYTFDISTKLNKPMLKKLIESLYNVDVCSINMVNLPTKRKRQNTGIISTKVRYKRAIVKLKQNQKLPIF